MMLKNNDAAPKDPYKRTLYASYLDYVVQGIVNNVNPILLIYYQRLLGLPLTKISVLIAVNFAVQIATDLLSSRYVGKVGIRKCMLLANGISALGLIGIAVFPMLCANAYPALLAATVLNAVGGGLIEVLVSPIVEAIPGKHKDKRMSMLHSFYSWGCATWCARRGPRWWARASRWRSASSPAGSGCARRACASSRWPASSPWARTASPSWTDPLSSVIPVFSYTNKNFLGGKI